MIRSLLTLLLLLSACSRPPAQSINGRFVTLPPGWCVDVKYRSGSTLEVGRLCFRYQLHCRRVRAGALEYGGAAGVVAVSQCWR